MLATTRALGRICHILPRVLTGHTRTLCTSLDPQTLMVPDEGIPLHHARKVLSEDDYFGVGKLFTLEDLFNARVHMGHKEGLLNDHMRPYIYGKRIDVHIIDLEQTAQLLRYALNVTAHIAYNKGLILFVNRSRQTGRIVELAAKDCGEYANCRKWKFQAFTNADKFFNAVTRLPDLCIFFSVNNSAMTRHRGVVDSAKMLIPSVGIVDTDCDPTLITYPIPGNDDTPVAIQLYADLFKKAVMLGKQKRAEHEAEMQPVEMT